MHLEQQLVVDLQQQAWLQAAFVCGQVLEGLMDVYHGLLGKVCSASLHPKTNNASSTKACVSKKTNVNYVSYSYYTYCYHCTIVTS